MSHDKRSSSNESLDISMEKTRDLSGEEFMAMFHSFKESAFRLETLSQYLVDQFDKDYEDFLRGEPLASNKNDDWCNLIASSVAEGKSFSRVHILPQELSSYLRFEIEWGYVYNVAAGSDIRLLEWQNVTDEIRSIATKDFWLFDNTTVVLMDYSAREGRYEGARVIEPGVSVEKYNHIRQLTWGLATDFRAFLSKYRRGEIG